MQDKTWQYANQIHFVKSVKMDDDREEFTIITNLKTFDRPYDSAEEFLKFWTPATNLTAVNQPGEDQQLQVYREESRSSANKLIAILEDNIAKVKMSKDYIPQATAINNNINTIVNIQKMKMKFVTGK